MGSAVGVGSASASASAPALSAETRIERRGILPFTAPTLPWWLFFELHDAARPCRATTQPVRVRVASCNDRAKPYGTRGCERAALQGSIFTFWGKTQSDDTFSFPMNHCIVSPTVACHVCGGRSYPAVEEGARLPRWDVVHGLEGATVAAARNHTTPRPPSRSRDAPSQNDTQMCNPAAAPHAAREYGRDSVAPASSRRPHAPVGRTPRVLVRDGIHRVQRS